jgi:hypothetical protein
VRRGQDKVNRQYIDPKHKHLSVAKQFQLIALARSSWYYKLLGESPKNLGPKTVLPFNSDAPRTQFHC